MGATGRYIQMDRQTDMTKIICAFRDYAKSSSLTCQSRSLAFIRFSFKPFSGPSLF